MNVGKVVKKKNSWWALMKERKRENENGSNENRIKDACQLRRRRYQRRAMGQLR